MPIYEFKCLKCEKFIELLVMNKDNEIELRCPECSCEDLERVLSTTSYSMGNGSAKSPDSARSACVSAFWIGFRQRFQSADGRKGNCRLA